MQNRSLAFYYFSWAKNYGPGATHEHVSSYLENKIDTMIIIINGNWVPSFLIP